MSNNLRTPQLEAADRRTIRQSYNREGTAMRDNPDAPRPAATDGRKVMRDYLRALPVFAGNLGSEPAHLSAADFRARPAGSRAEASPGRQSQDLPDRRILDVALEEALARVRDQDLHETRERTDAVVPRWTLYNLDADEVEFWQGDRERKHTRLRYTRTASGWARTLLWP